MFLKVVPLSAVGFGTVMRLDSSFFAYAALSLPLLESVLGRVGLEGMPGFSDPDPARSVLRYCLGRVLPT